MVLIRSEPGRDKRNVENKFAYTLCYKSIRDKFYCLLMWKASAGERLCRQQLFIVVKYDFRIGIPPGQQSQLFNRFFRASEEKQIPSPAWALGSIFQRDRQASFRRFRFY